MKNAVVIPIMVFPALWVGAVAAAMAPPTDPHIIYSGRWDLSNPQQPWAQAQGSSIIANFEGRTLIATFDSVPEEFVRVVIDDDGVGSKKLALQPRTPMTLAQSLSGGPHKVEIVKETDRGRATFLGFELEDGARLLNVLPRRPRRIEFYGDSNLAGFSLESERNQRGDDLVGAYYTYAGIVARMFDAEHVNHSKSGATISSLLSAHNRTDWNTPTPLWNYTDSPADLVVVNIGANDRGPKQTIKGRYHNLLDALRIAHPAAPIVVFNAWGWDFNEPANYTSEVVNERDDPNMSVRTFPWIFEQFHGCEYDHGGMAANLARHISDVTGWTPKAQDLMNGYGEDGDVANGSFEEVAPFGGWGWRYFDDPGVSRLRNAGAFDGEHHLRLSDGAATHQNIPASDGDTLTVTAWIRGAKDGDQVDITLDFRDQDAGGGSSSPRETETETKTLTTSWRQYTMTATAPIGASKPVFHARIALKSVGKAIVEIDLVVGSID